MKAISPKTTHFLNLKLCALQTKTVYDYSNASIRLKKATPQTTFISSRPTQNQNFFCFKGSERTNEETANKALLCATRQTKTIPRGSSMNDK